MVLWKTGPQPRFATATTASTMTEAYMCPPMWGNFRLILYLGLFADSAPVPVPVSHPRPSGALQHRRELKGLPGASARPFPGGAAVLEPEGGPPLRETTSAAYCPRPRCDRRGVRRGLPPLALSASLRNSGGFRRTTSRTARPDSRFWARCCPCLFCRRASGLLS